jgi:hypothetical protein
MRSVVTERAENNQILNVYGIRLLIRQRKWEKLTNIMNKVLLDKRIVIRKSKNSLPFMELESE